MPVVLLINISWAHWFLSIPFDHSSCLQCCHSTHCDIVRLMLCFQGFRLAAPTLFNVFMPPCPSYLLNPWFTQTSPWTMYIYPIDPLVSHISKKFPIIQRIKCNPWAWILMFSKVLLCLWISFSHPLQITLISFSLKLFSIDVCIICSWTELYTSLHCLIRMVCVFLACPISNQILNPLITFIL